MTTRSRTHGQLLLFAMLLFGIVTMHTLGHPSSPGPAEGSGHGAHAVASVRGHEQQPMAPTGRQSTTAALSVGMPPMSGMDPLSVCLAVLGGFTLVLLLALAVGSTWTGAAAHPPLTRLLRVLWPHPPPPRTLLSRLSVLRI